ncbi:hypothetical protein ABLA30_22735 [Xenorhabdus nematophila]
MVGLAGDGAVRQIQHHRCRAMYCGEGGGNKRRGIHFIRGAGPLGSPSEKGFRAEVSSPDVYS